MRIGAKNKSLSTAKIIVIILNNPMLNVPPKDEESRVQNPERRMMEVKIIAFPVPTIVC
jgi:hypothetical protein